MSDKITKLEDYRAKKGMMEEIDFPPPTKTEENILSVTGDGNEIVTFEVKEKSIRLTFYNDDKVATDLMFYVDENGNIDTEIVGRKQYT